MMRLVVIALLFAAGPVLAQAEPKKADPKAPPKKPAGIPDSQPRKVQRVGVVGAGLMATQLATLFLRKLEVPVVLTDVDAGRAETAAESIRGELAGLVAKGRLGEGKARFLGSIVTAGSGLEAYEGCDLVLEAVFEPSWHEVQLRMSCG